VPFRSKSVGSNLIGNILWEVKDRSESVAINHKVTSQETGPRNDQDWIETQFDRHTFNLGERNCLVTQSFVWLARKIDRPIILCRTKSAYLGYALDSTLV
jgi:hypothetical protein